MKKPIMAIMYDFDKTLCDTDMQNYSFIPNLGLTPKEFWGATTQFSEKTGVERILSYMYMMIVEAHKKGIKVTRKYLNSLGKDIHYYPGVINWFKRINAYGKSKGVKVEHYLVSSGTKEILDGCSIAKEFKGLYGCEYYYDEITQEPVWPKLAINYTQKTQFFFRISKGITDITDDNSVNAKTPGHRIPQKNFVYLGDGMTDIPCMQLVKQNGGFSIAVYKRGEKEKVIPLVKDGRVNFICKADYSQGSEIEKIVRLAIERISISSEMEKKEASLK